MEWFDIPPYIRILVLTIPTLFGIGVLLSVRAYLRWRSRYRQKHWRRYPCEAHLDRYRTYFDPEEPAQRRETFMVTVMLHYTDGSGANVRRKFRIRTHNHEPRWENIHEVLVGPFGRMEVPGFERVPIICALLYALSGITINVGVIGVVMTLLAPTGDLGASDGVITWIMRSVIILILILIAVTTMLVKTHKRR